MLNKIISFSVHNKLIIGLFVIALIGYGSYQVTKLPIDAVPDITDNQVIVITQAPALGASDIERLITFPIEQANSNILGIKELRSFSRFGLSLVTIVFDDDIDIYWARQQVAERLQSIQSQIPPSLGTPEMGPISTGLGEIYQYVVKAKKGFGHKYDATELRTIQDWTVRRQLLGVKGVAEVSSFGGKLKQYEVVITPGKLNALNLTINDVIIALESNNQNTGGAYIEKGPTVLFIRTEGLIGNKNDIENIAIKNTSGGAPIYIKDIAEVKTGFATRYGAMCFNADGEVSGAIVMMLKGANSNEVIETVKARIAQIQKTLPEGVEIEPFLDRTKMVNNSIKTVSTNLLEGALIVVFVLVLFLGNLRAGLIVASVIPLSMLFAISLMNYFGVSGNLMSLGALDFGLIVDGAVIIVEAVLHSLAINNRQIAPTNSQSNNDQLVESTSKRMMNSAVFGQIIILIVYLPIFTLQGVEGKMFRPMAQTVAFALLGAFILSLTYVPMMSALFLRKNGEKHLNFSEKIMEKIEAFYQKYLTKFLKFPKLILSFVFTAFVLSIIILYNLGGEFIPELEEGDFAVDTRVLVGSNLNTTIEYTQKAAKVLINGFPEVEKIVTKIGSGEVPTDPMPMEASDLMVILKDKSEWTSAETFDELSKKMSDSLKSVVGITASFQYPVQMRFNELMTGARQDVVCKIFGENLDSLSQYANQLGKIVNTVEGAQNVYIEQVTGVPQIIINYDRAKISQYGITISQINNIVNTAFAGQNTGQVFEDEKRFNLVVKLADDQKRSLEDVRNLLVPTPNGQQIPLSFFANVDIKEGPNQIQREDAKRRITVGFNIGSRDVASIVTELQKKIASKMKFDAGYYITYGGSFEKLNEAKTRLMIAVPISLLLIFILLFFAFKSIKQSLLIYTAIPLSAIGGILFLALRGMPFSISAGVGFIALFGVSVLNGIVLIAEFNRLKTNGLTDTLQIVVQGSKLRLRPILTTAFVASLGFLPMAISNGSGAEVQRPLATVVIGGLLIATFLTLFILPILYIMVEKSKFLSFNKAALILVLFCTSMSSNGQIITISEAIQKATENSPILINEKRKAEYLNALTNTAFDIPNTTFGSELGQFNSNIFDTKFAVSQTIKLPNYYKKQKDILLAEAASGNISEELMKKLIEKEVSTIFYQLAFLKEKEKILQKADSTFSKYLEITSLQVAKGEKNQLDKVIVENELNSLKIKLKENHNYYKQSQIRLQFLLNSDQTYTPDYPRLKMEINPNYIPENVSNMPLLKQIKQDLAINNAINEFEKTKNLPEINTGIYIQSYKFNNADIANFWGTVGQIGINIPLFNKSYLKRSEALRINSEILENKHRNEIQRIEKEQDIYIENLSKTLEIVDFYENVALKNAQKIVELAQKQYLAGEINIMNFVNFLSQNLQTNFGYLEAVNNLNNANISLKYLN